MWHHVIRKQKLGLPQSSRDVFTLLASAGILLEALSRDMKKKVGFRKIAVQESQALPLPITITIITTHLDDFLRYSELLLQTQQTIGSDS